MAGETSLYTGSRKNDIATRAGWFAEKLRPEFAEQIGARIRPGSLGVGSLGGENRI